MRSLAAAVALVLAGLAASAVAAQPVDSLASPRPDTLAVTLGEPVAAADSRRQRTPRAAVTRALLLPGLGQVYNRQPVKAPIAAALVAGGVVYAVDRQLRYRRLQLAARYAGCNPDDPNGDRDSTPERVGLCDEALVEFEDEWEAEGSKQFAALTGPRDQARGRRDIGVLAAVVAYAFQAFDAYVFAELADFDVSEDVVVGLEPGTGPPALALRVRL